MSPTLHAFLAHFRSIGLVEAIAVVAGFISVYLTLRNKIGTWFWGLVSTFAYGYLFYQQKNWGNAGLNLVYYTPIQIYGWYVWLRFGPKRNDDLAVSAMTSQRRIAALVTAAALSVLASYLLKKTDDPYAVGDGVTTALCIVAQYLEVHKRIENWVLWIVADLIYVFYLFPVQQDYLSAALYVAFLIMSGLGLRHWLRLLRTPTETPIEMPIADSRPASG